MCLQTALAGRHTARQKVSVHSQAALSLRLCSCMQALPGRATTSVCSGNLQTINATVADRQEQLPKVQWSTEPGLTFLHIAAEHARKHWAGSSQDCPVSTQCLPFHNNGGIRELHLLVHGLHGTAQLQIHDAAVFKVPCMRRWLLPDALNGVHLMQALIFRPHVVQACN